VPVDTALQIPEEEEIYRVLLNMPWKAGKNENHNARKVIVENQLR
jgi:hypothetical protein